ncbi:MAG: methyltransferase domain-containing protein [Spirochaetales bacterium]|nr:methyltransferase domain-containing protein [Spirochaetales bacterium]
MEINYYRVMAAYDKDINFDDKFERLTNAVYNTPKGIIRTVLLREDLADRMPELFSGTRLRVLDAGCGTGEMSRWAASKDLEIVRIDISSKMLDEARRRDKEEAIPCAIEHRCEPVQTHANAGPPPYDIIICHGMLAWLADPEEGFNALSRLLKPGGRMSLVYYNRNRNILRNGLLANFYCLRTGDYRPRQKGGGLTPINPLDEAQVYGWAARNGLTVEFKSGIRIFFGLANNHHDFSGKEEALLRTERMFYRREPFSSIGVHTHLILRKNVT